MRHGQRPQIINQGLPVVRPEVVFFRVRVGSLLISTANKWNGDGAAGWIALDCSGVSLSETGGFLFGAGAILYLHLTGFP
jgi:hypothetical protein